MKRFFTLLVFLCLSLVFVRAQSTPKQQRLHMAAERIGAQIGVADDDRDTFISLYQAYKKEMAGISAIRPEPADGEEAAVEAKIRCDFLKSAKILEVREKYYNRFRTVLRPSQIQKMYNIERQWAAQSAPPK